MSNEKYPGLPVLVVDDEKDFLTSIKATWRINGITNVKCCNDSLKVLPLLKKEKFSLILLDIIMPGIGGEELLPKIKEEYPKTPVIMLTALNETIRAFNCVKNGAHDYIAKDSETPDIVAKIKNVLDLKFTNQKDVMQPKVKRERDLPCFLIIEASYYKELLERTNNNKSEAARLAGINKRTFNTRLKRVAEKLEEKGMDFSNIDSLTEII